MESATKWLSPRSVSGSMILALLGHVALYTGVILAIRAGFTTQYREASTRPEEIAYETLDAPPAPVPVPRQVVRAPRPDDVEEKSDDQPDPGPKEMHDDSSTIAGTQAAAPKSPAPAAGNVATGTAPATPYYKIKPKYPRAALVNSIEGWVLLKVDIDEKGEVANVRVIGGQERSMFQDEARRAVEKWKYQPVLDGTGRPTRVVDHEVRVDFKLRDAA